MRLQSLLFSQKLVDSTRSRYHREGPQTGERTELWQIQGEQHLEVAGCEGGPWQVGLDSAAFRAVLQSLGGPRVEW